MFLRPLSWLLMLVACAAAAETDRERAERLQDEAKALRTQAEERHRAAEAACYGRFLVNRCIKQANEARLEDVQRAREMENEASRIELAEKQRRAAEAGRIAGEGPTTPAAPAESVDIVPDAQIEVLRRSREAEAAREEEAAIEARRQKDAAKAQARAKAEAEAAERAAQAARDRERYDARLRKREAEAAKE